MTNLYKPPGQFSFNASDWPDWYADWKRYVLLTEINAKDDIHKINALLYHMGTRRAERVMQTFSYGEKTVPNSRVRDSGQSPTIQEAEKDTCYADVIKKFDGHYSPKVNVVNESTNFNKRVQGDESIDSFLIDLQQLVLKCEYQDPDRQVRDRFIAGIKDSKLQEKLQFQANITLEKAVGYARRWEALQEQMRQQHGPSVSANEVSHRGRSKGRGRGQGQGRQQHHQSENKSRCQKCGYMYHKNKHCPALRAKCNHCSRMGHFSSVCKSKRPNASEVLQAITEQSGTLENDFEFFLGAIDCTHNTEAWQVNLEVCGTPTI